MTHDTCPTCGAARYVSPAVTAAQAEPARPATSADVSRFCRACEASARGIEIHTAEHTCGREEKR